MEDGTGRICSGEGRLGVWYAYNDGFGTQWPAPQTPGTPILPIAIPGGPAGSTRAMFSRYVYANFDSIDPNAAPWGAGIGLDLSFDGVTYGTYDASRYDGITFFARSSRESVELHVRVNTTDSTLVDFGGTCLVEFCNTYDYFFWLEGIEWKRYSVRFADLHPYVSTPGLPEFRRDLLTNIQFLFVRYRPTYADTEIWIDDVSWFQGAPPAN